MRDIGVATFHEMLEQTEDPIRLMDRYLAELREQIHKLERLYRQCQVHVQFLKRQLVYSEEMKQKREHQAYLAMKADEEEMARLAIQEKVHYEEKSRDYRVLCEESEKSLLEMENQLLELKMEYQELLEHRGYFQARLETVRLQQQMNQWTGKMGLRPDRQMFRRIEERISDLELESKAWREVRQMTRSAPVAASSTALQAVEEEMNRLRQRLSQEGCK
jgi:phage shock protein A